MATIKEIAEKAGVSIGTVDRVLHNRGKVAPEKRERILRLIDEMDYRPNSVARRLALLKKKLRFSFYAVHPEGHPFFEDVLFGARRKAEELSQYGVEVDFHFLDSAEEPAGFPDLRTDGIVMLSTPLTESAGEAARERDIPIVYYNVPPDDGHALAYVGCDYEQSGRIAAGLCALTCGAKGKVGVMSEGDDAILSFTERLKGFQTELAERYPDMEITGIYPTMDASELPGLARKMLRETPDLDAVYLVNPADYSACRAIHQVSGNPDIRIITNDVTGAQRPLMEAGLITAAICQEPERQGAQSLEILFQYVANGTAPAEKNCYTNLSIHIRQNM